MTLPRLILILILGSSIVMAFVAGLEIYFYEADVKNSSILIGALLSLLVSLYMLKSYKNVEELENKNKIILNKYLYPTFFCAFYIVIITKTCFWWLSSEANSFSGGWWLLIFYAFVFNELPTKGLTVVKSSSFKKRDLPLLVLTSSGYLLGFYLK